MARHHTFLITAAAGTIAALLAICSVIYSKGWEQIVTGLPHWSVTCPANLPAILVIGQSQASNTGPRRHIGPSGAYAFAAGKCYRLRDPMPGTDGRGGSIWPTFASKLGQGVLVADIAISGSAIEQWTLPKQVAKVRRTIFDLQAAGYHKQLVIWMQGETNGARRTSSENYYAQLRTLLAIAPRHRWLITRESICYGMQNKWVPLDQARARIARDYGNVRLGPDLDTIPLSLRQADQCHLTVEGQARLASELAVAVRPMLGP